jgi:hypothetical protein
MTHERFIELLNLYLDGELPPNQAAELERTIASDVDRRRIYRQYCQMQKACSGLSEYFREEAAPAPNFRQGKVVAIAGRGAARDWLRSIALVASGALAACAVFVAVRQMSPATGPAIAGQPASTAFKPELAQSQLVPFTTTVALNANPAGFRNPWNQGRRDIVVDFSRMTATNRPLGTPDLRNISGVEDLKVDLRPYGEVPTTPLRLEEIEANAFQFQR